MMHWNKSKGDVFSYYLKDKKVFSSSKRSIYRIIDKKTLNKKTLYIFHSDQDAYTTLAHLVALPQGILPHINEVSHDGKNYYMITDSLPEALDKIDFASFSLVDKIYIMKQMAKKIAQLHQVGYSLNSCDLSSVYIKNKDIFFSNITYGERKIPKYEFEKFLGIQHIKHHIPPDCNEYGKSCLEILLKYNKKVKSLQYVQNLLVLPFYTFNGLLGIYDNMYMDIYSEFTGSLFTKPFSFIEDINNLDFVNFTSIKNLVESMKYIYINQLFYPSIGAVHKSLHKFYYENIIGLSSKEENEHYYSELLVYPSVNQDTYVLQKNDPLYKQVQQNYESKKNFSIQKERYISFTVSYTQCKAEKNYILLKYLSRLLILGVGIAYVYYKTK